MQDVAALESLPLLGFSLTEDDPESSQQFQLYHKNKIFYIFKTDDPHIYNRSIYILNCSMKMTNYFRSEL